MSNISWGYWTRKVSSHIRFKPDRAAVEEELLAHLEDKRDALIHGGMVRCEAEKKALSEMGDADEIGEALAAAHRPWLGYLWLWSRRALILLLAVLVWAALGAEIRFPVRGESSTLSYEIVTENAEESEFETVTYLSPACTDESDGYTFSVPKAAVIHAEAHTVDAEVPFDIEEGRSLFLVVECTRLLPMAETPDAFRHFYAVDDLGNLYPGLYDNGRYAQSLVGNPYLPDLWHGQYDAWISELHADAQWVELRYDRDGRDIRLRIDLTGGEGR